LVALRRVAHRSFQVPLPRGIRGRQAPCKYRTSTWPPELILVSVTPMLKDLEREFDEPWVREKVPPLPSCVTLPHTLRSLAGVALSISRDVNAIKICRS
jgi:hypothetical protein